MTFIFGIVNVSPDSFSGDGLHHPLKRCERLIAAGADGLDVGAVSTRPGAPPVTEAEEHDRLFPVLSEMVALCREAGKTLSVDTFRATAARAALEAGADMINDVSGGADPLMAPLLKEYPSARYVFMHSLAVPADAGVTLPPECDPVEEVLAWKVSAIERFEREGIDRTRLIFDPGVGFGKNASQSWALIRAAARMRADGTPLYIGHSRKSFLQPPGGETRPEERDPETLAVSVLLAAAGTEYVRVHDVTSHARAFASVRRCIG